MDEIIKSLDILQSDVITPVKVKEKVLPQLAPETETEDIDYNFVRDNYYEIINQGQAALAGALRVAIGSEHPRAYEVVGSLLKSLADVNRQLLQVGEDKQKVKAARKGVGGPGSTPANITQNNAIFVGNSSDLNKLLAGAANKEKDVT